MSKFDIHKFFYDNILKEADDDSEEDLENNPSQMGQGQEDPSQVDPSARDSQNQEGSPSEQSQSLEYGDDLFSVATGKTVKKIEFERPTSNAEAGGIKVYLAGYQIPLTVSWSNGRVTMTSPENGEIYPLT